MCSVFLLAPFAGLQLDGLPTMREMFKAEGFEHQYRVVEPLLHGHAPESLSNVLRAAKVLLPSDGPGALKTIRRALYEADPVAREEVSSWGVWEAARFGMGTIDGTLLDWTIAHCVEVERAAAEAEKLIGRGDFSGAAATIRRSNLLAAYMSERMAVDLAGAQSDADSLRSRAAALFEFQVSQVARVEVRLRVERAPLNVGGFLPLLVPAKNGRCRPGGEFLRWLQRRRGLPTIKSVLDHSAAQSKAGFGPVNEATLKRWSSGASFPTQVKLKALVRALATTPSSEEPDANELEAAWYQFWAARRFNLVLTLAEQIVDRDQAVPESRRLLYLMDTDSIDEWSRRRYAWWLAYWAERTVPA